MTRVEKFQILLSYSISFVLVFAIAWGLLTAQWFNVFLASLAFGLTYIPAIIERNYRITLPLEFELVLMVFVYAAIYLGEIHSFYLIFPWWDTFLHTLSGFLLGFVGFVIIYVLDSGRKVPLQLSPFFMGFFAFIFSVALAGLWEIFEFFIDLFFDLGYQPSLHDTMIDMIVNVLGSLCTAFAGALYVQKTKVAILTLLLKKFVERNPRLFKDLQF